MAPTPSPNTGYGPLLMGITWAEAGLGTSAILGRTFVGWKYTKRFRIDYWLSLLTYTLSFVGQIFLTISVHHGLGEHIRTLSPDQISASMHTGWVCMILGIIAIVIGKLSFIAFLDQVRGHQKSRPWILWFIALSNIVVNTVVIVLILVQCSPYQKLWDDRIPGTCNGRALNQHYAYFQGSWSAVSDLVLSLYPISLIYGLQMALKLKIILCILMGFGILAAICSSVKTAQLTTLSHTDDVTYYTSRLVLTTDTEAWIILIVGCIPPLRPLLKVLFDKARGTSQNSNTYISSSEQNTYGKTRTVISSRPVQDPNLSRIGNHTRPYRKKTDEDEFELTKKDSKESVARDHNAIFMTTDVQVKYEQGRRRPDSEGGDSIDSKPAFHPV